MRKDFDDCLELIESKKIRQFVEKALAQSPGGFWTAPCSGSGKYHPPENQVKGGIIVHTRKVVQVALSLFRPFEVKDQLVRDKIIAACIIHDIHKYGNPWGEKTDYEHGLTTYDWLKPFVTRKPSSEDPTHLNTDILDRDLMDIIELIRDHMGIWSKPEPTPALEIGKEVSEKAIWHQIIQLADYIASREWLPFTCDEFVM